MRGLKPYAKTVVSVVGGAASAVVAVYGGDTTAGKAAFIVLLALTTAGVYRVKNAPLPPKQRP